MALYPLYNLIKRGTSLNFASTSFVNNGAEWAVGFLLGIGLVVACVAVWPAAVEPGGSWHMPRPVAPRLVCYVRTVAGAVLCATSVATAVLLGASWRRSGTKDWDDGVGGVDVAVVVLLLAVPLALAVAALATGGLSNAVPGRGRPCDGDARTCTICDNEDIGTIVTTLDPEHAEAATGWDGL